MEITRSINVGDGKLKRKVFVSMLLASLVFVFLFCLPTRADYAPVSSEGLNLSGEFGKSWAKDDVACSVLTGKNGENITMLTGYTSSFGAGGSDVWLIKVALKLNYLNGQPWYYRNMVEWTKTFGGAKDDMAKSVIQSSDDCYVLAGQTKSYGAGGFDMYLLKVDSDGNVLWNMTYGGSRDDGANCVVQTTDGGFLLAGYTLSGVQSQSTWLVKTDASGRMQWSRVEFGLEANSIVRTSDGGYALATKYPNAFTVVKLDSSAVLQWSQTYIEPNDAEAESAIQTSDGGYAVTGWSNTSTSSTSARLIKLDSSGNIQWGRTYAGLGAYALIQTSDGGYALTGDRAFLMITDSLGNVQWNQNYDALSDDNLHFTRTYSIIQPAPNQFVMAGTQQSYGQILTGLDGRMITVTLRWGDVTPPKITVLSPENKIYTTSNVPLICTVDKPPIWMAYQIDKGRNITITGNTTVSLPDGRHNMTVYAADADYNNGASNTVFFSNFAVDTVPINVTVTSIQNITYTGRDVPLNFTVGKEVLWTAYTLDGQANITIPQNATLTGLSFGSHTLTVYAQDTIGLIDASDTVNFVVADNTIPEFPNILIAAFALALTFTIVAALKTKCGHRDLNRVVSVRG